MEKGKVTVVGNDRMDVTDLTTVLRKKMPHTYIIIDTVTQVDEKKEKEEKDRKKMEEDESQIVKKKKKEWTPVALPAAARYSARAWPPAACGPAGRLPRAAPLGSGRDEGEEAALAGHRMGREEGEERAGMGGGRGGGGGGEEMDLRRGETGYGGEDRE
uniref:Uncharacterized protein n=1 Tax=Oryza sativa subsp. japonica TaxID=39947 RepID=Q6K252_ORYSJ|nr:hypothetical protein [Oryza sativa Japonica Group]BAD26129.1 hypothetical protein [Oryza sativa Japonica Group]